MLIFKTFSWNSKFDFELLSITQLDFEHHVIDLEPNRAGLAHRFLTTFSSSMKKSAVKIVCKKYCSVKTSMKTPNQKLRTIFPKCIELQITTHM